MKNSEICTKFIETFFKKGSTWDEVSKFVVGEGEYAHPLIDLPTIRAAHECLNGPFIESFPDLNQVVNHVFIAEDDANHLIVRTTASATFINDWLEIKANGRRWEIPVDWEFKLENGLIRYAYELGNHHAINNQLDIELFRSPAPQE